MRSKPAESCPAGPGEAKVPSRAHRSCQRSSISPASLALYRNPPCSPCSPPIRGLLVPLRKRKSPSRRRGEPRRRKRQRGSPLRKPKKRTTPVEYHCAALSRRRGERRSTTYHYVASVRCPDCELCAA